MPVKLDTGGGDAPAYAPMEVTGTNSDGLITVKKPSADNLSQVVINGPTTLKEGGEGQATQDYPARVYYDTGTGTPAVATPAQTWGTLAGSWKLNKDKTGFRPMGGNDAESALFEKPASAGTGRGLKVSCFLDCVDGNLAYLDGCIQLQDGNLVLLDGLGDPVAGCDCP